ncbi:MAG: phosphotransferase, partial [Planctomycetota bacterium]
GELMSYATTAALQTGLEPIRPGAHIERIESLAGDASARTFRRVHLSDGSFLVAMSTPTPPIGDGGQDFLAVGRHLQGAGVAVPTIEHTDLRSGLTWVEDLGDDLLENHCLARHPERRPLYRRALAELIRIQHRARRHPGTSPALSRSFDTATFLRELRFFSEHTLEGLFRLGLSGPVRTELDRIFADIAETLATCEPVLCHRDYHCRNLMVQGDRLRVIDFQDARLGPAAYDLASLLHDPYAMLEDDFRETLLEDYRAMCAEAGEDVAPDLEDQLALATVQRCLKAAGTYGYQVIHRKRHHYRRALGPALASVGAQLDALPRHRKALQSLLTDCEERLA